MRRSRLLSSNSSPSSPNFTNLANLLQGHIPHSHLLQLHAHIYRVGAHRDNLIATRLIGHYPSQFALRVFHQLQTPNVFPFNAMIRVLAEEGLCPHAFSVFKILKSRLLPPNDFTFSFLLKACFLATNALYVLQVHSHVLKSGFVESYSSLCNSLIVVYARGLKDVVSARKLFDELPANGEIGCWTSLIYGFARSGQFVEVLHLFLSMTKLNLRPENDTMVSVLSACSNLQIVQIEKWVRTLSACLEELDSRNAARDFINIVLVYLFGKWGKLDQGREIFDEISDDAKTSVLAWNAMIGAYAQNGCAGDALSLFRLMMSRQLCCPNHVTMVSVVSACTQAGDIDLGIWVHEYVQCNGATRFLALNKNLATALIDMYSKCGNSKRAREVFDEMVNKDVVSFNAMIMGLAMNGEGEEALNLFSKMQEYGLSPNNITFLGILCACSHSGLLDKGRQVFAEMKKDCRYSLTLEHYACYVDLLARMGCVEEAFEVVISMPFKPNAYVWGAVLGGCLLHNRVEWAQYISKMIVELSPDNSSGYVMLSNAFAADRRWDDVMGLRWYMRERGVSKQPGSSWISLNGIVHQFLAGSLSHPQIDGIYCTLNHLTKELKLASQGFS